MICDDATRSFRCIRFTDLESADFLTSRDTGLHRVSEVRLHRVRGTGGVGVTLT